MIADLKPYPVYKDSGVEWLGDMPEHWSLTPNRSILRRKKVLVGNRHTNYALLSLTRAGVIIRDVSTGRGKFSADMGTSQEVRSGDFIFCLFDIPETPRTVGLSRHNGMITGAYSVFECDDRVLSRFLETFYIAMDDIKALSPLYSGLRNTIPPSRFLSIKTPVPPRDEQAAIVRFLDHADRRIRRYIRAKHKLITLLEEQKQAIIHQAVTGQVDVRTGQLYPAYKDSGVEWLGDVPEHWDVQRARYIFHEVDRRSLDGSEQHLSMSQQLGLVPSHLVENRTLVSESYAGGKLCRAGDLVLNRLKAHLGVFALAQQSGVISPDYTVLRPNKVTRTEYYEQVLRLPSCRGELRTRAKGIVEGFWRLYTDDFNEIRLPLLPKDEQCSITEWIRSSRSRTDRNVTVAEREISLLREYRTRLIADVVTGKLDVCEAAAGLPEVDPLADEFDAPTTQAAATGMMELEDATETLGELAMENEATV